MKRILLFSLCVWSITFSQDALAMGGAQQAPNAPTIEQVTVSNQYAGAIHLEFTYDSSGSLPPEGIKIQRQYPGEGWVTLWECTYGQTEPSCYGYQNLPGAIEYVDYNGTANDYWPAGDVKYRAMAHRKGHFASSPLIINDHGDYEILHP